MRHKRPSARTFDRPFWAPHADDPRSTGEADAARYARPFVPDAQAVADAANRPALLEEAETVDLRGNARGDAGADLRGDLRGGLRGDEDLGETDGERKPVHPHGYRRSLGVAAAGLLVLSVAIWKPWTAVAPQPDQNVPAPVQQVQAAQQTAPVDQAAGSQDAGPSAGIDAGVWAEIPGVAQDVVPTPDPAATP